MSSLTDRIDALLPQTQCTRCGYPTCRQYAQAVSDGSAEINQCPPGGEEGVRRLAVLLARDYKPLDPKYGVETAARSAWIDEARCIGCMLCIRACPVDAIIGTAKRMHSVLTAHCTGCELCLPPCPVDCIEMVELSALAARGHTAARERAVATKDANAQAARARFATHNARLAREKSAQRKLAAGATATEEIDAHEARKKATIRAALERARARRANPAKAR
jgi:Na+-translocating ferredoxin:NAD+ oxidoreductase subunit B